MMMMVIKIVYFFRSSLYTSSPSIADRMEMAGVKNPSAIINPTPKIDATVTALFPSN